MRKARRFSQRTSAFLESTPASGGPLTEVHLDVTDSDNWMRVIEQTGPRRIGGVRRFVGLPFDRGDGTLTIGVG